jgi:hypothetical protein
MAQQILAAVVNRFESPRDVTIVADSLASAMTTLPRH